MTTRTRLTSTRLTRTLLAAGVGATLALGTGVAIAQTDGDDATTTTEVTEALHLNLEEERMARDLYDALGEAHDGLAPFTRIEVAEQRHYDAVASLITRTGGTLPDEAEPGVYAVPEIQAMYDDWLERGLVNPEAAFEVGVELETADIEHLRSTIADIDDADVDRVLGHLLEASEHHLAAFEAAADGELPARAGADGARPGGGPGPGMTPGEPGQGRQQGHGGHRGMHDPGAGQGQGAGQGGQHLRDGTGECPWATTDD